MTPPSPSPSRDPADYAFWLDERTRYADIDSLGHVNNVAYAVYFEGARVEFIRQHGLWSVEAAHSMVAARVEIDYLREVRYPSTVRVGVRCTRVGTSSFVLDCAAFVDGECVATCRSVQVRFDPRERRASALPPADRERLLASLREPDARGVVTGASAPRE